MAAAKKVSKLLTKDTKILDRASKMFDNVLDAGEDWAEDKIKALKLNKSAWNKLSNEQQVSKLSEALSETTKQAIAYNHATAPSKLRPAPAGKPVDKQRLRELRKKYADQTKDFTRAGGSNFNGKRTESILNKENKRYATRQYNKEKGRLEHLASNGSKKEMKAAQKQLENLKQEDFMPNSPKQKTGTSIDKNSTMNKVVGYGVGGGLVFSMFNNKGQQSNEQLYGQR